MKRFDADIGSTKAALQETPEVLQPIGVNLAACVGFSVVHEFMEVFIIQPFVTAVRVCIDFASSLYVLADDWLKVFPASVLNCSQSHFGFSLSILLEQPKNSNLADSSASSIDQSESFLKVHI